MQSECISCFVWKDFLLSWFEPSPHLSLLVPPLSRLVTFPGRVQAAFAASLISPVCCNLTHQLELSSFPSACLLHFYSMFTWWRPHRLDFFSGGVVNWVAHIKWSTMRSHRQRDLTGHQPATWCWVIASFMLVEQVWHSQSRDAEPDSLQVYVIQIMCHENRISSLAVLQASNIVLCNVNLLSWKSRFKY